MKTTFIRAWVLPGALLTLSLLASCTRRDCDTGVTPVVPEVGDSACVVIPRSSSDFGYSHETEGPYWWVGAYNPHNAEEALVSFGEYDTTTGQVRGGPLLLNLRTGSQRPFPLPTNGQYIDWHRNGWILFTQNGEAWKMKATGDSVQQITHTGGVLQTEQWSPDGKQLLGFRAAPGYPYEQTGLAIYSATGVFVRLLPDAATRAYHGIGWSPDGRRLAYVGGPVTPPESPRLCIYDLTNNQLDTIGIGANYTGSWGVHWLPNGNDIVWSSALGVGITNVNTRQTRLVRSNCPGGSRGVQYPVVSPDGQQLLMLRTEFAVSATKSNYLTERYWLETCNLRGTQIRKVTP